jgi:hypothetical protein
VSALIPKKSRILPDFAHKIGIAIRLNRVAFNTFNLPCGLDLPPVFR